jgi:hypothetical protein
VTGAFAEGLSNLEESKTDAVWNLVKPGPQTRRFAMYFSCVFAVDFYVSTTFCGECDCNSIAVKRP